MARSVHADPRCPNCADPIPDEGRLVCLRCGYTLRLPRASRLGLTLIAIGFVLALLWIPGPENLRFPAQIGLPGDGVLNLPDPTSIVPEGFRVWLVSSWGYLAFLVFLAGVGITIWSALVLRREQARVAAA